MHAGLNKTGSSNIQFNLYKNQETLKKNNVLWPQTGIKFASRHIGYIDAWKKNKLEVMIDQLYTEAKDNNAHTVFLSDESFNKFINRVTNFAYFKKYFDEVQVILYLRRQDALFESAYNQMLKVPWDKKESQYTLQDYIKHTPHWYDYAQVIDDFSKIFGRENITIRIFERDKLHKKGIFMDILSACNLEHLPVVVHNRTINDSIPNASLEIARNLNRYDFHLLGDPGFIREALHRALNNLYPEDIKKIMSYEERMNFLEKYKEGNKKIAQEFFNRELLFNEDDIIPDHQVQQISLPDAETLITDFFAPVLYECKEKYKELKKNSKGIKKT